MMWAPRGSSTTLADSIDDRRVFSTPASTTTGRGRARRCRRVRSPASLCFIARRFHGCVMGGSIEGFHRRHFPCPLAGPESDDPPVGRAGEAEGFRDPARSPARSWWTDHSPFSNVPDCQPAETDTCTDAPWQAFWFAGRFSMTSCRPDKGPTNAFPMPALGNPPIT